MPAEPILVIACLCAAWCDVCRDYRAIFDRVAARAAADRVRFEWIDIEDEAERVGDLEVENFPSLLITRGVEPLFFGPLMPQPVVLERLVERALAGQLAPFVHAPEATQFAGRLADG